MGGIFSLAVDPLSPGVCFFYSFLVVYYFVRCVLSLFSCCLLLGLGSCSVVSCFSCNWSNVSCNLLSFVCINCVVKRKLSKLLVQWNCLWSLFWRQLITQLLNGTVINPMGEEMLISKNFCYASVNSWYISVSIL
jgi:hypothetical protein